ncbi:MAG: S26 family signal peptidase [Sphingobium sp.]|nr:S26 family signal peptidase [Sphingobium sp.]
MSRFGYVIVTVLVAELFAGLFALVAWLQPQPRLIWNASASVPVGLYRINDVDNPPVGTLVVVTPPDRLAHWLSKRGYLPDGVPLLKYVAAKTGQQVCRTGNALSIDGRPVATARSHDSQGRALPSWQGCRKLASGEIFLLNPSVADSVDGRYFGVFPASALLGRAIPILTRETAQAPLQWRGIGS